MAFRRVNPVPNFHLPSPFNKRTEVTEAELLIAAKKLLTYHKVCFRRIDSSGKTLSRGDKIVMTPGSHVGMSDIIGCFEKRFFAMELKAPGGRVSQYQKDFLLEIEKAGGFAAVVCSVYGINSFIADLKKTEDNKSFSAGRADCGVLVYG